MPQWADKLMWEKFKNKSYHLLRQSEKYTKTDMVYLTKGGFWLTLGQIISAISTLLLAIAFANLLPKETYGEYKYILSLLGILTIPTLVGINTALSRAIAQGNDGSYTLALKTKIYWGSLGSLGSLILSLYYYLQQNHTLTFAFLIIAIFVPFIEAFLLYSSVLQGKKKFKILSKYNIIISILASLSIFIAIYFTRNLFAILFTYLLSYSILRFIFFKISSKYLQNKKEDAGMISYGKKLSLMGIIVKVAAHFDKILIFYYLGAIDLAIYSFAIAIPEQAKPFIKNLSTLAFPKFSQQSLEATKNTIFRKIFKAMMVISFFVLIYIFLAPIIYKTLFPQYIASIPYSIMLAISLIAVPGWISLGVLKAHKITRKLYLFNTVSPIFRIIILFILINYYGLTGAVISVIISRFFDLILSTSLLKKTTQTSS